MRVALGCLAVLASAVAGHAAAQQYRSEPGGAVYRSGEAPVMQQRPADAPNLEGPVKAFGDHYRSAGRPRIALFWNVQLADNLAVEQVKQNVTVGASAKGGALAQTTIGPKDAQSVQRAGVERSANASISTERQFSVDNTKRRMGQLTESDGWRIETGFTSRMAEAGVQFVDRAAILRIMQAKGEDTSNVRLVESKALVGMADLIMEVLSTRDAQAPTGSGFRITLRDLKTGQQKAAFYSQAAPEVLAPERRFVATEGGYQPVAAPTVRIEEVGAALALDAMRELVGRLR